MQTLGVQLERKLMTRDRGLMFRAVQEEFSQGKAKSFTIYLDHQDR